MSSTEMRFVVPIVLLINKDMMNSDDLGLTNELGLTDELGY